MLFVMRTAWGSSFQSLELATEKLRSPNFVFAAQEVDLLQQNETRETIDVTGLQKSAMYRGASSQSTLYVSRQNL